MADRLGRSNLPKYLPTSQANCQGLTASTLPPPSLQAAAVAVGSPSVAHRPEEQMRGSGVEPSGLESCTARLSGHPDSLMLLLLCTRQDLFSKRLGSKHFRVHYSLAKRIQTVPAHRQCGRDNMEPIFVILLK